MKDEGGRMKATGKGEAEQESARRFPVGVCSGGVVKGNGVEVLER